MYRIPHIAINQVANGWILTIAASLQSPMIMGNPEIDYHAVGKAFKKAFSSDDELDKLIGSNRVEETTKQDQGRPSLSQLPVDNDLFVFEDFDQLLLFLAQLKK